MVPLYSVHSPGFLLLWTFQKRDTFFFVLEHVMELRGCVFDPSSQGRLRLLSGTPQGTMEPLKVATGFIPRDKIPTTEKHLVVILGRATQFHLGDQPTLAFELSAFQTGLDLRMRVVLQSL